MIQKIFTLAFCFVLLACSNDDNGPEPLEELPTEFNIEKFTRLAYFEDDGTPTNYKEEYLFDEVGKVDRQIQYFITQGGTMNVDYSYNDLKQVTEKSTFWEEEDIVTRTLVYEYDNEDRLENIILYNHEGDIENSIIFTYQGNIVNTESQNSAKSFTFDNNGKLIETFASGGDPISTTLAETIHYSNENITNLHYESSLGLIEDYDLEYDEKINPIFENFNNTLFNNIVGFVGSLTDFKYFFSKNNYAKITYTTSNSQNNYTEIKTTEYNEDGYPVSAQMKRNDVLFEELIYEYY